MNFTCRMMMVQVVLVAVASLGAGPAVAKPGTGAVNGVGRVFLPNPVAFLQDQTLTDQKDADYAALLPAYQTVVLTNLDGSGYLRGDWAVVTSNTGTPAYSKTGSFLYNRHDDQFEQVMAYFWVTQAQKYIQSLGFGTTRPPINMEAQDIRINQWGVDNSYSWEKHDVMRFGKGGVDDAEDADVILHEYGHSMMDSQANPFGSFVYAGDTGGICEGFADYWAVTMTSLVAPTPDPACIGDWDSVSYTTSTPHCLRRIDRNLHYPEDLTGLVHRDGMLWSRALWDIRSGLGNVAADTIILQSMFDFPSDVSMPAAAEITVETAMALYGPDAAAVVFDAFAARGMLVP